MSEVILFDLDGTLVDSSKDITDAVNYSLKDTGIPAQRVERIITLVGEGITRLLEKLLAPELSDKKDEVLGRFLDYYSKHLSDNTKPYPFVEETLFALKDRKKAVISNKREFFAKEVLRKLGLIGYFDAVIGSDSVAEKKPSPLPINVLLDGFAVSPDKAIMVGDGSLDIQAGKSAGVITVGVTYGYRDRESLKDADFLIDTMAELTDIVHTLTR